MDPLPRQLLQPVLLELPPPRCGRLAVRRPRRSGDGAVAGCGRFEGPDCPHGGDPTGHHHQVGKGWLTAGGQRGRGGRSYIVDSFRIRTLNPDGHSEPYPSPPPPLIISHGSRLGSAIHTGGGNVLPPGGFDAIELLTMPPWDRDFLLSQVWMYYDRDQSGALDPGEVSELISASGLRGRFSEEEVSDDSVFIGLTDLD